MVVPTLCALGYIAVHDARTGIISNRAVITVAGLLAADLIVGGSRADAGAALLGAVAVTLPLAVAHLGAPMRMGGGDVKLGAVIGALVAAHTSPLVALGTLLAGLLAHVVVLTFRRAAHGPMAPALTASTSAVIVVSVLLGTPP